MGRRNLKKLAISLMCAMLLVGCGTIKTTIEQPDGSVYAITSKKDSIVTIHTADNVDIEVNNQGQQSAFEWFMVHLLSNTDIQVGDDDDEI